MFSSTRSTNFISPTARLGVVLCLSVTGNSGLARDVFYSDHRGDCALERKALKAKIDSFIAGGQISKECEEALNFISKPCVAPDWKSDEPNQQTFISNEKGILASHDNMINLQVDAANTLWRQAKNCSKVYRRAVQSGSCNSAASNKADRSVSSNLKSSVDQLEKCLNGRGHSAIQGGQLEASVRDRNGNFVPVSAQCGSNGNPNYGASQDIAVCRLDQKIDAAPLYMTTLDDGISTGCVREGWVMRCSREIIAKTLDGAAVRTETFPITTNKMVVSEGIYRTGINDQGQVVAASSTYSQPATSGGGQVTTINGYPAIVIPNSYHNSYWRYHNGSDDGGRFTTSFGNQGVAIDNATFMRLQVKSVSQQLVANSQEVMTNFAGMR